MMRYPKLSTLISNVSDTCRGIIGYFFIQPKSEQTEQQIHQTILKKNMATYQGILEEIEADKDQMLEAIGNAIPFIPEVPSTSESLQFFSAYSGTAKHSNLSSEFLREKAEREEIKTQFFELISSYPQFDESFAQEPSYLRTLIQETLEHHNNVKIMANELCIRLGKIGNEISTHAVNHSP